MKKSIVATDKAPKAIGPYAQAVRVGDLMFISGQIPLDPATNQMATGDIKAQTRRALENIRGIVQSQGLAMSDVVKTTVFMTDLGQFAEMNSVYAEFFMENPPARATVQVSRLPKDALVEIEAIVMFP
jgi:2-iminobutanoate/2-iminopropanoate deaminase